MAILSSTDLGDGVLAVIVDHDPTIVSTNVPTGSLIVVSGNSNWYRKLDDGSTTNVAVAIGTSGYSGISGYSGYSGVSGYSGYSGIGTSGYSGYSGINGVIGSDGASGYSGYSGVGVSGYSGYSGAGISGYSGYSGSGGNILALVYLGFN